MSEKATRVFPSDLSRCAWCGCSLGPDNLDGSCAPCDDKLIQCPECDEWMMPETHLDATFGWSGS